MSEAGSWSRGRRFLYLTPLCFLLPALTLKGVWRVPLSGAGLLFAFAAGCQCGRSMGMKVLSSMLWLILGMALGGLIFLLGL